MACVYALLGWTHFAKLAYAANVLVLLLTGWTQMWLAQSGWLVHPHTVCGCVCACVWQVKTKEYKVCKYHMVNSKGFAPGNSWLPNSSEPRREMPQPSSSFPSWPNYATAGGKGRKGQACRGMHLNYCHYLPQEMSFGFGGDTFLAVDSEVQASSWCLPTVMMEVNLTVQKIQLMIFFFLLFHCPMLTGYKFCALDGLRGSASSGSFSGQTK